MPLGNWLSEPRTAGHLGQTLLYQGHGRQDHSRAAQCKHGADSRDRHEAGDDCSPLGPLDGLPVPATSAGLARHTGLGLSWPQSSNLRARVLLASASRPSVQQFTCSSLEDRVLGPEVAEERDARQEERCKSGSCRMASSRLVGVRDQGPRYLEGAA